MEYRTMLVILLFKDERDEPMLKKMGIEFSPSYTKYMQNIWVEGSD